MRIRSTILKLAWPAVQLYWRIRKPYFRTVRVVVRYEDEVLLVRHAYGAAGWGLPGGGLGRSEDPLEGGVREVREETGIRLEKVEGIAGNPLQALHANGELWVFVAEAASREHEVDHVEIIDSRWVREGEFPTELLAQARHALDAAGVKTS